MRSKVEAHQNSADTLIIPNNLDEALAWLQKRVPPDDIAFIKEAKEDDAMGGAHFGIGMNLRNAWKLWHGSVLAKWFNAQGIYHADDMSGIILTSFIRAVKGQDIELPAQIKYYRDYWISQGYDPDNLDGPKVSPPPMSKFKTITQKIFGKNDAK